MTTTSRPGTSIRRDPAYDGRRVVAFAAGLVLAYAGSVLVLRPGPDDLETVAVPLMFAPTVGALAAVLFAHGRIQIGRPTPHLLLAFLPPAVILAVTWSVAAVGDVDVHPGNLATALLLGPVLALSGSLTAVGEEIGWRGFLWPLLRRHLGFWTAALVMLVVWWLYHLPVVLWWGYGFVGGLTAFTVGIAGFVLFVGVLAERSNGVWASVLAHGAWNGLVATAFAASLDAGTPVCAASCPGFGADDTLFTGSQSLLGEFGWVAALTMAALGALTAVWHLRHPVTRGEVTS